MNEKSTHTLISQSMFQQIIGRFRDNNSLDITMVSEIGDIKVSTPDKDAFKRQINAAKGLQIVADSLGESFSWMDYKQNFNYLTFRGGKITPCVEAYMSEFNTAEVINSYKNYNFINYYYKKQGQGEIAKNVTLQDRITNIEDYPSYPYYSLIKECIDTIGLQNTLKCKSIKAIKNALIDPNLLPTGKIREKLGLSFKWYSCKDLKAKLQKVGIYGPASKIKEFYNAEEMLQRKDSDVIRGFMIKG